MIATAVLTLSLLAADAGPTPEQETFRFLGIPITGTVGADGTAEGVEQAIALAIDQRLDGLVLDIDAREGDLDDGLAIAALVSAAAEELRTVAVLRRAGGAALPVLFACEDWIVLDRMVVEARDERGELVMRPLGESRAAIQASPPLGASLARIDDTLAATAAACRRALPGTLADRDRAGRTALVDAVLTIDRDLRVDGEGRLTAIQVGGPDAGTPKAGRIVPVSSEGPGITAVQLDDLGLARLAAEGLAPLATALGYDASEPFGDVGAALVASAADDRARSRSGLGSRIDTVFSSLDGAGQLSRALPWTLSRARLSDPLAARRSGRLPMVHADGAWRLAPESERFWTRICGDSIRRWEGVVELLTSLEQLLERASTFRQELVDWKVDPADRSRLADALRITGGRLEELRALQATFEPVRREAAAAITRLEGWKEKPPAVSTTDGA